MTDSDMFPEEFDPFKEHGEEYESILGPEDVEQDDSTGIENFEEPVYNDVELHGLRKLCTDCRVLMDSQEATAAEIYGDPSRDDMDLRTWAKCHKCGKIVVVR